MNFPQLHSASLEKLRRWDLTRRERDILSWIVELSFGAGRVAVWIRSLDMLVELTRISRPDVSRTLGELQRMGVLQISGGRREGPRRYAFLPNADLVEPESRALPAVVAKVLSEIAADNAQGPGEEPGGQLRMAAVEPAERRLAEDLASASRERALEKGSLMEAVIAEMARRSMRGAGAPGDGPLVIHQRGDVGDLPTREGAEGRARTRAPETSTSTLNNDHDHVVSLGVGTMTKADSAVAARAYRSVFMAAQQAGQAGIGEFNNYRRKWEKRCAQEPELVIAFAEDCIDRMARWRKGERGGDAKEIAKPAGWIYFCVRKVCGEQGREFK